MSLDPDAASRRQADACQQSKQRRFPRAIATNHAERFPMFQREAHVSEHIARLGLLHRPRDLPQTRSEPLKQLVDGKRRRRVVALVNVLCQRDWGHGRETSVYNTSANCHSTRLKMT